MDTSNSTDQKTIRLYFKTYLQLIRNSVGTEMFRNFYVVNHEGTMVDALSDGSNSCSFYVSSVLTIFQKLSGVHGTISATKTDLEQSGWQQRKHDHLQPGDVVVWEALQMEGTWYEHIGFYIGDDRAISTSWTEKKVVEHNITFAGTRKISQVFHFDNWEM